MQARSFYEHLSVCQTRELWQNETNLVVAADATPQCLVGQFVADHLRDMLSNVKLLNNLHLRSLRSEAPSAYITGVGQLSLRDLERSTLRIGLYRINYVVKLSASHSAMYFIKWPVFFLQNQRFSLPVWGAPVTVSW